MSMSEQEHDNDEIRNAAADEIERLEAVNEELIRGMTEMAERFTARMDGAAAQIDELRECLILAVKELDVLPVSIYSKGICERARKALGLQ
jgi:gamma-glutamyl:cysteine ligase YbdK (ATP-grasp superfamily)